MWNSGSLSRLKEQCLDRLSNYWIKEMGKMTAELRINCKAKINCKELPGNEDESSVTFSVLALVVDFSVVVDLVVVEVVEDSLVG